MQRLEVSGAVRVIYRSLGVKGLSAGRMDEFPDRRLCYSLRSGNVLLKLFTIRLAVEGV